MTATREDFAALSAIINSYRIPRMLQLVAELGVADRIAAAQFLPVTSLASEAGILADPLLRILRALASVEIFIVDEGGMIGHSRLSLLLRTDSIPSLHHAARFFAGGSFWNAWGALDKAMHGAVPFESVFGVKYFDYLTAHPDEGQLFNQVMTGTVYGDRHGAVAAAYNFSNASLIADIGGGNGALLPAILPQHPQMRGVVFDLESVVQAIPAEARLDGRISVEPGNFFHDVMPQADIYILSRILHDWPDDQCLRILRNCRRAMAPGARLLVVESVLGPLPTAARARDYLLDVGVMVLLGGRERTLSEFQALLDATGFGPAHPFETAGGVSVIESMAV
jgi:hypothetical protein